MAKFGVATEREGNRRGSRGSGRSGQRKKGADFNSGKVSKMVLRSGRKHVHSAESPETPGWTGEESDPEYRSGDEGGSQHNARAGHRKGYRVKGKGKVEEVKRRSTSDEREDGGTGQDVDIDIRHRCALDAIYALTNELSDIQKEAVRGMVWSLVLEYRTFLMDRQLVQALLQAWNPESKCFKLGQREVSFSHFDVALLTGFPASGKRIAFERSDGGSEVEQVLKGAMEERVRRESTIYAFAYERRVPRLSSWVNLYKDKKYDAGVVVRKLKDSEIIPVIEVRDDERRMQVVEALIMSEDYSAYVEDAQEREALTKEKEVHAVIKKELAELKKAVAMKTTVEDILEFVRIQGLNSTADAPERLTVGEEGTNTDIFTLDVKVEVDRASPSYPVQSSDVAETIAVGESVPSGQLGAHPIEAKLVVAGEVGEV
ncbi:hypothetical protein Cgig2_022650 [Carnegiea gigantea]|uniref:Uncharacterized protein n=1 Tax=Carnegiea gigantea TaxID=171969 RepID=A0A9Q1JPR7_9CARY|nr:hypothetical protein Cgig2_022650 [Carnegiea gigantea]